MNVAMNQGTPQLGIKGPSIFASIVPWEYCTPTDYMHRVLEGVTKRLVKKWVNSKNNGNPFSNIDRDLVTQQPLTISPEHHTVSRSTVSIGKQANSEHGCCFTRSHCWLAISLHFTCITLLLVCAMHILLQPELC